MCDVILPVYGSAYLVFYIGFYTPFLLLSSDNVSSALYVGSPFVSIFQQGEYAIVEVDGVRTSFVGDVCSLYGKRVLPGAPLQEMSGAFPLTLNGQCLTSYQSGELVYGTTLVTHAGINVNYVGQLNYTGYDYGYQLHVGMNWGADVPGTGDCSPVPQFAEGRIWWDAVLPCQGSMFFGDKAYYMCKDAQHVHLYTPTYVQTTFDADVETCWGHDDEFVCSKQGELNGVAGDAFFYGLIRNRVLTVVAQCSLGCILKFYDNDELVAELNVPVSRIDRLYFFGDTIFLFYDTTLVYGNSTWTRLHVPGEAYIGDLFVFPGDTTRIYDPRSLYGGPCWHSIPGRFRYFDTYLFNSTHYVSVDYMGPCDVETLFTLAPRIKHALEKEVTYTAEPVQVFNRCAALEHMYVNESGSYCVSDVNECEPGYWLNTSANEDGATSDPCVVCVDCIHTVRVAKPTLGSTGPITCPPRQYRNNDQCLICSDCWMTRRACGTRDTECYTFTRDAYYFELIIGLQVVFILVSGSSLL